MKKLKVTERFSEGQPWGDFLAEEIFTFQILPSQFDPTLETCFKVLMKEIKIGKAVETLDGKNQTAKCLIASKYLLRH